ncbi:hypothetical protein [Blastococcus sp. TF02A-30]|uniref:hypothetical protein n=1 Tax=Blastococcus sp. TF02A-30 TaxID=2250580 RepID=UPI00131456DC|nr:hypothetical protein [Blastococcus sp. TF02A-30]
MTATEQRTVPPVPAPRSPVPTSSPGSDPEARQAVPRSRPDQYWDVAQARWRRCPRS